MLLDEPTAALDIGHQQQALELLDTLRAESALTLVAAMHDLTLAAQYADRMILLDDGQVAADGTPAEVLTRGVDRPALRRSDSRRPRRRSARRRPCTARGDEPRPPARGCAERQVPTGARACGAGERRRRRVRRNRRGARRRDGRAHRGAPRRAAERPGRRSKSRSSSSERSIRSLPARPASSTVSRCGSRTCCCAVTRAPRSRARRAQLPPGPPRGRGSRSP